MGHHLDIPLCAVKVGKDKGHFIVRNPCAVSARLFAFGREDIQQFPIEHGTEENLRFRGERAVEVHGSCEDLVR